MSAMVYQFGNETSAAPLEAKKNEFNPYQDNGGYVSATLTSS